MSVPPERSPAYPPRFTYPAVRLLVIAALKDKPRPKDGLIADVEVSPGDMNIRRIVDRYVLDRQHREQLRIWAWCQEDNVPARGRPRLSFQEASFREQCEERGWNRATALRNVEYALGMVLMMMNMPNEGRF